MNHIHDAILDPACRECTDLTRRLETGAEERRQIIARLDAGEFDLPNRIPRELHQRAIGAWYEIEVTRLQALEDVIGGELPEGEATGEATEAGGGRR